MDRQNGVLVTLHPALVDHFLRAALNFRVAALHGVKVQLGRVGPRRHRAGRATAHANAHTGATQLNQQASGGELDLLGLARVDHP